MKVRVVKVSRPTYWYKDRVGEIVEVNKKTVRGFYDKIRRYQLTETPELVFDVCDVEIIYEEFVFR